MGWDEYEEGERTGRDRMGWGGMNTTGCVKMVWRGVVMCGVVWCVVVWCGMAWHGVVRGRDGLVPGAARCGLRSGVRRGEKRLATASYKLPMEITFDMNDTRYSSYSNPAS